MSERAEGEAPVCIGCNRPIKGTKVGLRGQWACFDCVKNREEKVAAAFAGLFRVEPLSRPKPRRKPKP